MSNGAMERESRRIARFTRESGLPTSKTITSFEFHTEMIPYKSRIEALSSTSDWVERADNLLIFGLSGVGKTHLAAAIGHNSDSAGHSRTPFLFSCAGSDAPAGS